MPSLLPNWRIELEQQIAKHCIHLLYYCMVQMPCSKLITQTWAQNSKLTTIQSTTYSKNLDWQAGSDSHCLPQTLSLVLARISPWKSA
jgi:hypothetical protein